MLCVIDEKMMHIFKGVNEKNRILWHWVGSDSGLECLPTVQAPRYAHLRKVIHPRSPLGKAVFCLEQSGGALECVFAEWESLVPFYRTHNNPVNWRY